MKTRISAIVCLLCVFGYSDLSRAEEPPTMSSGTIEPYLSFMAGVAIPNSPDATFSDGTTPTVVPSVDYSNSHSIGGNAGIWFPTRDKLSGFDLGFEITGFVWYPDVTCCRDNFNNDSTGLKQKDGIANNGTTTEVQGIYVGTNFLIRYPMAISEAYPNGRWHPYVGLGVGAHQLSMKPGGFRGGTLFNAITDQRDTTVGWMAVGGIKAHLFKYVAAFAEAKYLMAHHDGLTTDRYGNSPGGVLGSSEGPLVSPYSSSINTVFVHAGLSIHFDIRP